MNIGNVEISGYCALAPMAGVADRAFRELCKSFGAAYTVGEMVSAKGVTMNDKKSEGLMLISDCERPSAIQLFGNDPEIMAKAARVAMSFNPEIIDINMGCPAPKVIKNSCGSALMKDVKLSGKIVKAVVDAVNVPVTVKMRSGWDKTSINCVDLAKEVEENGAAAVCIHGRTKEQMYAPPADLDSIKAVKDTLTIPVIGNGDIFTPEDAEYMYEYTGCDLIMVGRGALGSPWLFSQINEFLTSGTYSPAPTVSEKMKIMLAHANRICELRGEKIGMCETRKHALWYTKGLKGSAKLRKELSTVKSMDELTALSEKIILMTENEQ